MKTLKSAHFYGTSVVSKLIQFQTGPYSHSAVWIEQEERDYIQSMTGKKKLPFNIKLMEQWPHGGFIESWMDYNTLDDHTKGTKYEVWGLEMSELDWEYCMNRYIKSCEDKREYDWAAIVHFKIRSVKEDPIKTFCSEEVIIPICEILSWDTIKPYNIHPTLAVNLLQAAGGKMLFSGVV